MTAVHSIESLWVDLVQRYGEVSAASSSRLFSGFEDALDRVLEHPDIHKIEWQSRAQLFQRASDLYRFRFPVAGEFRQLDRAVDLARLGLNLTPIAHAERHVHAAKLASALLDRFLHLDERLDLDEALEWCTRALQELPADSPLRVEYLNRLGTAYNWRYGVTHDRADLTRARQTLEGALQDARASNSYLQPLVASNLSAALAPNDTDLSESHDINRAVDLVRSAVRHTDIKDPEYTLHLSGLADRLTSRFVKEQRAADIDEAIDLLQNIRGATGMHRGEIDAALARAREVRYLASNDRADIDEAIRASFRAITGAPKHSRVRVRRMVATALRMHRRFQHENSIQDLEPLIELMKMAVSVTDPEDASYASFQNKLGVALLNKFALTARTPDLDSAIEAFREAVARIHEGARDASTFLINLGIALKSRSETPPHDQSQLAEAIRFLRRARELTPEIELAFAEAGLAAALSAKYSNDGDRAALEEAITLYERAMGRERDRAEFLHGLGVTLTWRFELTRALVDLDRGIELLKQAVAYSKRESLAEAQLFRTISACLATQAGLLERTSLWDAALAHSEHAWRSLQKARARLPVRYKLGYQEELAILGTLLTDLHLVRAGERPVPGTPQVWAVDVRKRSLQLAFLVAEGVKSRLLSELVGRGWSPPLGTVSKDLLVREQQLLDSLTVVDLRELGAPSESTNARERIDDTFGRERMVRELESVWEKMVAAGAIDYVASRRGDALEWDDFVSLTKEFGPDTILISQFDAHDRAQLFILRTGDEAPVVCHVELQESSWREIIQQQFVRDVMNYDGTERQGQHLTWSRLLRPLLEQARPYLHGAKRIVFSPRGIGNALPWSAVAWEAGWRTSTQSVPLVTLPALGFLKALERRCSEPRSPVLHAAVFGNPKGNLADAETEAEEVGKRLGVKPLLGPDARREKLLDLLPKADVIHIAAHARFFAATPLASEIEFSDGVITAREILDLRVRADLIVLSACETGRAATLEADELLGLSQAFLQAGARSLIVSLWEVHDQSTADFMSAFYEYWQLGRGRDKAASLSAAADSVREHAGWEHPFYWAPFILVGDWR